MILKRPLEIALGNRPISKRAATEAKFLSLKRAVDEAKALAAAHARSSLGYHQVVTVDWAHAEGEDVPLVLVLLRATIVGTSVEFAVALQGGRILDDSIEPEEFRERLER